MRKTISKLRHCLKLLWNLDKIEDLEGRLRAIEDNLYAEIGDPLMFFPKIMTMDETLDWILENNGSICRFGDGEFSQIMGGGMGFQVHDPKMGHCLLQILENPIPNCLVCLTNIFGSLAGAPHWVQCFSRKVAVRVRREIFPHLSKDYEVFGNADVTRPYWPSLDINQSKKVFAKWQKVFHNRDLILVEGCFTRLGIGNDLFASARSVRRILCPATNAFEKYPDILGAILRFAKMGDLILLALGGTATILAYDLSKEGLQAVDVGHIDIQYIYMKMGVKDKVMIPGKYTNECGGYDPRIATPKTQEEIAQIICEIK